MTFKSLRTPPESKKKLKKTKKRKKLLFCQKNEKSPRQGRFLFFEKVQANKKYVKFKKSYVVGSLRNNQYGNYKSKPK